MSPALGFDLRLSRGSSARTSGLDIDVKPVPERLLGSGWLAEGSLVEAWLPELARSSGPCLPAPIVESQLHDKARASALAMLRASSTLSRLVAAQRLHMCSRKLGLEPGLGSRASWYAQH